MGNGTAYLMILSAVEAQRGLIHGKLKDGQGAYCAIGSYFNINRVALGPGIVDEVAAVNDSVPAYSPARRKAYVRRWLKWRLQSLGMALPGRRVKHP